MSIQNVAVDVALLQKYNQSGPRYTSYPTAPYFHHGVDAEVFSEHLRGTPLTQPRDLSLYLHIPFCDTLCYFCGCTTMITRNRGKISRYLEYLTVEMDRLAEILGEGRVVRQMHWGGGTPTHLTPEEISRVGATLRQVFTFAPDAEVSVEIDPRELTKEHLCALREAGFNRVSMGVQDFDVKVQEAVNRLQSEAITEQAIEWVRSLGFQSLNLDLMYGLPHQTVPGFEQTLKRIMGFDPDRIAVFNYAHLPQMIKHQRIIRDEWLPGVQTKFALLKLSIESLVDHGYTYIGMDHFAKPEDELSRALEEKTLYRNFQGYSTHAGLDLIGLGMSSISVTERLYAQNQKSLESYYADLDQGRLATFRGVVLTDEDVLRREVITRLMCHFELSFSAIESTFHLDFSRHFAAELAALKPLCEDGLLTLTEEGLDVTPKGRLLIRNIAMVFDAYLANRGEGGPQFSRTV